MKKKIICYFFGLVLLIVVTSTFAQEVEISPWGSGFETSFSLKSGYEIPNSFSVSFQSILDSGGGLSLDFIALNGEYSNGTSSASGFLSNGGGLLGSLFLGFPIGNIFRPYVGGGIGYGWNPEKGFFAWKVDTGITTWLFDSWYVQTGVTYDNVRKGFGISVGTGFKLNKKVTDLYRNADGSTFRRTWNTRIWDNSGTPYRIYGDSFAYSEVVRTYQTTTSSSSYSPAQYEIKTSGGEILTTKFQDQYGLPIGTATTSTPYRSETVKTRDAEITTRYYVYNVTVTRNWYTRTWYYKDRGPTTEMVYQDVESAVLVNMFSDTERR
jgi:hypothetical protein